MHQSEFCKIENSIVEIEVIVTLVLNLEILKLKYDPAMRVAFCLIILECVPKYASKFVIYTYISYLS